MTGNGILEIASRYPVAETADRLQALVEQKGMRVFARIDQAAAAAAAGLVMSPMVLMIFGDPKAGTPLMARYPSLAIDLPLKALVRETADGRVLVSYNSPEFLRERHQMQDLPFAALGKLLEAAAGN